MGCRDTGACVHRRECGGFYLPGYNKKTIEIMKDAVKKQAILKILDYLSTDEGQQTIFQCFTGISSLSSYQSNVSAGSEEVNNCIAGGRIMPSISGPSRVCAASIPT